MNFKNAFEVRHPIFRPLWRRVLVCALCFVWAGVELSQGSVGWALLFAACGVYLVIQFFVLFDPADYEAKPDTPTERTDS